MGDPAWCGMKFAALARNPLPIEIHLPTAFIDINDFIDMRVDMSGQPRTFATQGEGV
jgi:hypothetical protein